MHVRRTLAVATLTIGALVIGLGTASVSASASTSPTVAGLQNTSFNAHKSWRLVDNEDFSHAFSTDKAKWVKDPLTTSSPWAVDDLDDNGSAWHDISDPDFTTNMSTFDILRKRVAFGKNGWLTAELASMDSNKDGTPDSDPSISSGAVSGSNNKAGLIKEPSWNSGALIRPTKALPEQYRIEVRLRSVDFGGKRNGSFDYDGKTNGYTASDTCKTGFPWTFHGSNAGTDKCNYGNVDTENGFYYLAILDHDNPSPHGNPSIHAHRKIIMDGYNADVVGKYGDYATCNPKTGEMFSSADSNYTGINAIFIRGDKFMSGQDKVGNEYEFDTACGEADSINRFGPNKEYSKILTSAELQPELMPGASYTFAVERTSDSYTIEYSGPFKHIGQATFRFTRKFAQDGVPIWHYNQKASEYDGSFNQDLTLTGPGGTHTRKDVWPKGSAYPDSFIIGDPHLNYYEGSAAVDDIRLYVPKHK